jgi:hypothetical protein
MKKNLLLLTVSFIVLSSCHRADKTMKETISNADSVAINYFAGDGSIDTVTVVKIIRDKNTMNQLSGFISGKLIDLKTNCGYDGTIHFFKNDSVVQDIKFRMNDENCVQFSFEEDGQLTATALSPDAKKLLEAIKK